MSGAARIGSPGPRPPWPAPLTVANDVREELRAGRRIPLPPGETRLSFRNTWRFRHDPLAYLLECYERHGPIFGVRILFGYQLMMIGPEANHFMLVSGRDNFAWRSGHMGDLIPLIGDGLLTTDGDYHDTSRAIMMPAFHRERVALAARTMGEEAARPPTSSARARSPTSTPGRATWRCGSRCGRSSASTPIAAGRRRSPPASRAGSASTGASTRCSCWSGPARPLAGLQRDRAALSDLVGERDRRAGGSAATPARAPTTSSARCSPPPTRRATR